MANLRFALVGNPNSGKTTLFNALTGSTAHVGNWPGVTVDKKEGTYKKKSDMPVDVIDLPGIYSLSPYTPEEVIARNYILDEKPDCIINIVDATNLERNLYLTTQLLEVDIPVVVALNMTDVLEKNGDDIDEKELEKKIGVPVVEISALKDTNTDLLMERAIKAAKDQRKATSVLKTSSLYAAIEDARIAFELKEVNSPLFHAVKLVEKDELEVKAHPAEAKAAAAYLEKHASTNELFGGDTEAEIADARYKYIVQHFSPTLKRARKPKQGELSVSDKADKVLTHKWFGIPIFLVILFAVFHVTFSENFLYLGSIIPAFGEWCGAESESVAKAIFFSADGLNSPGAILFYLMDTITASIGNGLTAVMESAEASEWAVQLVCDGVWGGIAAVLSFVPQILVLFLCFSILEDSGYMARVAFILDKLFRRFGVSGRAFMPMFMGFGCSIPAMANTRTLASERERNATLRVIPFFSCGAKLPILTAIAGGIVMYFKVGNAEVITYSMYVLGMAVAVVSLLVMRNTTMRGETAPFIMELPNYHAPRFQSLMLHLWDKLKHYVQKAFTIILVSCIAIWFFSNFGWNWQMVESMDQSILASLGKFFQPLFTPLGFGSQLGEWGWVFVVAAVTGLIAKENVVATFAALAACLPGLSGFEGTEEGIVEVAHMIAATGVTIPGLISFIAFNMTTVPCFAAVATAKGEVVKGKFKWTLLFWIVASYLVGIIVYAFGSMFGGSTWAIFVSIGLLALATLFTVGVILYNKKTAKKSS